MVDGKGLTPLIVTPLIDIIDKLVIKIKTMEDIKRKFVELFYPQELIRLVNKFGQEGTLNQKAMWQINKCVYVYWACILFLFLMFWSDLGFFRSAILFLLLYFFLFY